MKRPLNIRLMMQYDGTDYSGWQSQKNSVAIQDIIEEALAKVLGHKVRITGAGRTDAGVHAAGQVANFKTRSRLSLYNIKDGLNSKLPKDIVVVKAEKVRSDFHSRYDAKGKVYRYSFYTHNPIPPFCRRYVAGLRCRLDLRVVSREAKALLGRHDFSSFQGAGSKRRSAVRTIRRIDIRKRDRFLYLDIEADGFLYNMARAVAGTLIDIGRGHFEEGSMKRILRARDRSLAGSTAPAKGLCLMKVIY